MNKAYRFLLQASLSSIQICLFLSPAHAQPRLVLDGAKINIHNGATLIVTNPAPNAITRNSGHIISEGEHNVLQWHIGSANGSYLIPWGVGNGNYIPLHFTKSGGIGDGFYSFSTYGTGWRNSSSLPANIPSLEREGSDMSSKLVDRFWQINAQGYTVTPSADNITFTYLQEGASAEGNTLLEDNLLAYRWNEDKSQWDDYAPSGVADPATKTVALTSVEGEQFYSWWFLADNITPLPVELLFFNARIDGGGVKLDWATASEQNSNFFTVERSKDGNLFEAVKTVSGAGNSSVRRDYEVWDYSPFAGISYYRLKQTDLDGEFSYSGVQAVELSGRIEDKLIVYPNPTTTGKIFVELRHMEGEEEVHVKLFDVLGRTVPASINYKQQVIELILDSSVSPGTYILQIQSEFRLTRQKVIIK